MSAVALLRMKKMHIIFGYIITVVAKFNVINGWYQVEGIFYMLIGWEAVWLVIFAVRKLIYFPMLEKEIIDVQTQREEIADIIKITSVKEL